MFKSEFDFGFIIGAIITLLVIIIISQVVKADVIRSPHDIIINEAQRQNFDSDIALSIATVESNLNPTAIGPKGEIGLFQILPKYSPLSKKQLLDPYINARIGIMKLKEAQSTCPFTRALTWVVCYNNGTRHPKYPKLHPYYKRFMRVWASL